MSLPEIIAYFGIPEVLFFNPNQHSQFSIELFNQKLHTPLGVAAGPHSQIVSEYCCRVAYGRPLH